MAPSGAILMRGVALAFLSAIVLLPIAAVIAKAQGAGWSQFWTSLTYAPNLEAIKLTVGASAAVVAINAVFGTAIAWVFVRDRFPGVWLVNAIVDLPFALPTVVAGVVLLALYGPDSPFHVNVFGTRIAIGLGLLFVTLPFVTRAVQPVLISLDRDMEEAAAVLGARPLTIFFRIVLPNLAPALLAGAGLAFARALGEFGSVVILSSNIPNKTQVISLVIQGDISSEEPYLITQAACLSAFLLLLSLVVLIVFGWLSRRVSGEHDD
jgi:sulfate transport system permease protein